MSGFGPAHGRHLSGSEVGSRGEAVMQSRGKLEVAWMPDVGSGIRHSYSRMRNMLVRLQQIDTLGY